MSAERREHALARVVREVRAQQPPELDWQRAEARLLAKLEPLEPIPTPKSSWLGWSSAVALAAVATGALLFSQRSPTPSPQAATQRAQASASATQTLNGDALALAAVVAAGDEPRTVEHAGRVRWTLAPHSSATLTQRGEHLTIALVSGGVSAQVTPSQTPESFAVEVGGTRFAVHGTAFRVLRTDERATLEVSEGIVAVEPVGTASSAEFLLRATSRGEFALDGRTGKVEGNASVVTSSAGPTSEHAVARAQSTPSKLLPTVALSASVAAPAPLVPSGETAQLPAQLSIADVEAGVSAAVEIVSHCFRSETNANGIAVAVKTGMTLRVSGQGQIDSVSFGPALAPSVEACAVQGLRSVNFARSVEGASFTRILELSR
jgi:ferric-dicitrate binding protein FerR (iron transport regulator)